MRILLVDDEAPARRRLRRMIEELNDGHEVVGESAGGEHVVSKCMESEADLVLLDVRMPGPDGLELAGALAKLDPPPAVVLVTAYPEYAVDAFERSVADYLVKPVRRERLEAALRRLPVTTRPQRVAAEDNGNRHRRHLSAHYRGGVQTVAVEEVFYLLAEQKYVTVRHPGGRMLIDESLKALEEEFPDRFMRIHRNALVASGRLIGLEKGIEGASVAVLDGCDERLPVSRRHLPDVRRFLRRN
ncbi:MAG: LytTR family DNA-binding domain-containing protein [Thiohalocapsa sp.]|jgi:two-component system response regulator AlgR|nr:LytTR family DNA-binding domain-containing protein [Thiohalocapsa sp.]MCF7989261.1 LytTR family DNA-binding domain-containing protein [Thiohalocapsa sp.]